MFCGSSRMQRAMGTSRITAPASQQEPAAASVGSSPRRDPSRSKEIRPSCFPRPKISLSESMHNIKTLSRIILEANIPGQNQFLQGGYGLCGPSGRAKGRGAERPRAHRVPPSAALLPDAARESSAALRPESALEPGKIPASPLTLREALEIHKPQFISRSRERLRKLEDKVRLRKAQRSDAAAGTRAALLLRRLSSPAFAGKKRQYTVPHPLSDNLFKPKERFIPEKEMHMRSKRIYDNLPEVKKKQEEKQKRVVIQSNRLRVELFKKQLLDQLLQRNTE